MSLMKLTDVTLYWPFLDETNKLSGKYQVDVTNLSPKQVARLEEEGVNVRNKGDERNHFVTMKSAKFPIRAYHPDGSEIHCKVGNGTIADAVVTTYAWKSPTGQKGVSAGIQKLTITSLVEYESSAKEQDDEEMEIL